MVVWFLDFQGTLDRVPNLSDVEDTWAVIFGSWGGCPVKSTCE